MPNSSDEQNPRPARTRSRIAALAHSRRGIGIGAVAVVAAALAIGGLLGAASGPGADVAAASPSAIAAGSPQVAYATPSVPPSPSASVTPSMPAVESPSPSPATTPAASQPLPSTSPTPVVPPLAAVPSAALQARLDTMRAKLQIPGVSVAILWDDGRQWLGVSGMRDVAAKDAMTPGTAFGLASISKTFTAAVVLQLVGEGRLSLDQRVAPLLPDLPMNSRITVRQLLDHTSGIPDFFLNPRIDKPLQRAKNAAWTPRQSWAFVPAKRLAPGKAWIYSNSNYLALGRLVEVVTGRPLATEIRERLLDRLGLGTAWYQGVERPKAAGTRSYRAVVTRAGVRFVAVAPKSDVMPFRSVVTAAGGAGSIAATALDTARWMRAFAGGDVLTPALQRTMVADVLTTRKLKSRIPYGLGIQAVRIAGRYALGHSGRFLGIRNVVRYLPGEGVTIAVLTNQGKKDPAKIAAALLKIVLPPLPKPAPSATHAP
jgi:D-alanyl-D-alanine carboxypeptidase